MCKERVCIKMRGGAIFKVGGAIPRAASRRGGRKRDVNPGRRLQNVSKSDFSVTEESGNAKRCVFEKP